MSDIDVRAMTEEEDKYTFSQSRQISGQCGLIGHLRGDFYDGDTILHTSWDNYRADMNTEEFANALDEVINSLREEGDILSGLSALSKYCYSTPQSKMPTERNYYGVRADTEKYAFLLRLCPDKGDYNLYCYCYRRDWLDHHIQNARRGIRFIDSHYKEQFRIPDGDSIQITYADGEKENKVCRFIDPYHLEVGTNLYHICEFAERLEACGAKVIPLRSSLPELSYVYLPTENIIGQIRKGESGYYKTPLTFSTPEEGKRLAEKKNEELGVSPKQASAMVAGSMFGWNCQAADPKSYDAEGRPMKPKNRDREAR